MTKINGFTVDVEKLSRGLYAMCKSHPDSACMSLGMLPAEIMQVFDKMLKEKIPDQYLHCDTLEVYSGKDTRKEITHLVSCNVIKYASEEGLCIV